MAIGGDEDVCRFEVAMHDASRVCGRKSPSHLRAVRGGLAQRQGALAQLCVQRLAAQ